MSGRVRRLRAPGWAFGLAVSAAVVALVAVAAFHRGDRSAESDWAAYRARSGLTGGAIDLAAARRSLQRAAEAGHVEAQVELAFAHLNGDAANPRDAAAAFTWFSRAAAAGSTRAACLAADFYRDGTGGAPLDPARAVDGYRRTAETNDACAARSQYEMYAGLDAGRGVARDGEAAVRWLRRAAENGNPRAQRTLGLAYQSGHGVPQDAVLARHWILKSREGVSYHEDHVHAAGDDHTAPKRPGPPDEATKAAGDAHADHDSH